MLIRNQRKIASSEGFTLMELVVSMALFIFILAISMGSLLKTVDVSRKAESLRLAMDNLNFAMEDMSRTIRQGYGYHCGPAGTNANLDVKLTCPGGDSLIAMEPFYGDVANDDDQIVYQLNGSVIEKSLESGSDGSWYPITSPNIEINSLTFYYTGIGGANEDFPMVVIVVDGHAGGSSDYASDFTIQTSVTQRTLGD